jgi:predicted alpha/beta-fold hydrolase
MSNIHEYYNSVSLANRIKDFKIPTIFYNVADDAICG